jgi:hypothetical protein
MTVLVLVLVPACIMLVALISAVRHHGGNQGHGRDDDQGGGGGGGGSDRLPRPPLTPPGAGEPDWWPQFERDFARYVASRERAPLS